MTNFRNFWSTLKIELVYRTGVSPAFRRSARAAFRRGHERYSERLSSTVVRAMGVTRAGWVIHG
jgi:hypothetical protein